MLQNGILLVDHAAQWIHNCVITGSAQPLPKTLQIIPPRPTMPGAQYSLVGHMPRGDMLVPVTVLPRKASLLHQDDRLKQRLSAGVLHCPSSGTSHRC